MKRRIFSPTYPLQLSDNFILTVVVHEAIDDREVIAVMADVKHVTMANRK
jgi:hypothetical protein